MPKRRWCALARSGEPSFCAARYVVVRSLTPSERATSAIARTARLHQLDSVLAERIRILRWTTIRASFLHGPRVIRCPRSRVNINLVAGEGSTRRGWQTGDVGATSKPRRWGRQLCAVPRRIGVEECCSVPAESENSKPCRTNWLFTSFIGCGAAIAIRPDSSGVFARWLRSIRGGSRTSVASGVDGGLRRGPWSRGCGGCVCVRVGTLGPGWGDGEPRWLSVRRRPRPASATIPPPTREDCVRDSA